MRKLIVLCILTVLCTFNLSFTNAQMYVATAYCLRGRTASGIHVRRGIVAADRRIHKMGSYLQLNAGMYSGRYLVADTGGSIKGRRIDIWVASAREAMKFGKRKIFVTRD